MELEEEGSPRILESNQDDKMCMENVTDEKNPDHEA